MLKNDFRLKDQNKALQGLYEIAALMNDHHMSMENVLQGVLDMLKHACSSPGSTSIRVVLNHQEFTTEAFNTSEWEQSATVNLEQDRGNITIQMFRESESFSEEPFTETEKLLLETVASECAVYINKKMAEADAEQQHHPLDSFLNTLQDAIFIHDGEGNILEVNQEACNRLNYTRDELLTMKFMDFVEFKEPPVAKDIFRGIHERGRYKGETDYFTKEKKRVPAEITASSIMYFGQRCVIIVARDITQRKAYEKDLLIVKNKAEESARLKSAFLANLSHEIRTPLNAIMGFSDLLNMENLNESKKKEFIGTIQESGNKLLAIINDILDVSFIESRQIQVDMQYFSLNSLIQEMEALAKTKIHYAGKNINVRSYRDIPDGKDDMVSDPHRIQQVFSKLVDNAVKFTQGGNIEVGYQWIAEQKIAFYVGDTGIGVPDDAKEIVFERFRQLDPGTQRKYNGLGLGLSIAEGLVRQLGGDIVFKSKLNEGSKVIFTLPFEFGGNISADEGEAVISSLDMADKKILIAEDDIGNFLLVKEFLIETHAQIEHAENGSKALELLNDSENMDLILMDIKMPVMDGMAALEKIKQRYPAIPVIALTAYAYENDKKRFLEKGFDGYISKPVDRKELIQLIKIHI